METGTQSVRNALRIVEQVSIDGAVGVSDLARRLELPKSTVQRALATLGSAGWLRQDAQSRWALTLRCATISRSIVREHDVRPVAHPIAVALRDRTHETVRYFLVEGDSIVLLGSAESDLAVRPVESAFAGASLLHATALGRAALAAMPEREVARVLSGPLEPVTAKTLTDSRRCADERSRKYSSLQLPCTQLSGVPRNREFPQQVPEWRLAWRRSSTPRTHTSPAAATAMVRPTTVSSR
jgi:IclR family transcriptional regulator, acetate operon repressor